MPVLGPGFLGLGLVFLSRTTEQLLAEHHETSDRTVRHYLINLAGDGLTEDLVKKTVKLPAERRDHVVELAYQLERAGVGDCM